MSSFIDELHSLFSCLGQVKVRAMFGGYGIHHQGIMFALVADNELYLKVDKETQPRFTALGLEPFSYERGEKAFSMSYHRAPEAMFEDADLAQEWEQLAWQAALRAKAKKLPKN